MADRPMTVVRFGDVVMHLLLEIGFLMELANTAQKEKEK